MLEATATGPALHRLIAAAMQTEGSLLSTGETVVIHRFLALPPQAGHLYARLLHRVRDVLRLDGLDPEDLAWVPLLEQEQLLDALVPWPRRCELLRVAELRAACEQLGLPASGRKAELAARLVDRRGYPAPPMRRVRHRTLFQRLQRLFLRHPRADFRVVILDELGFQRRPSYQHTPGPAAFTCRAHMLQWEQARAVLDATYDGLDPLPWLPQAQRWLSTAPPATPGGRHFSTRRLAGKLAALAARQLERQGEARAAVQVYDLLLQVPDVASGELARRAVLAREAAGDRSGALALAVVLHPRVDPASAVAVARTGRRLARRLEQDWPAGSTPRTPPIRSFTLPGSSAAGPRPLYDTAVGPLPVEQALVTLLTAQGRRVLHGEGAPWSTLFALLFRDLYFLPVPGMLPVPWLSGPLDVGTPAFAEQRAQPLQRRLAEIEQGCAPGRVRRTWREHRGETLAGARWNLADGDDLATLAQALGGPALASVLGRLAREGWRARRGLPDLLILPGPEVRLCQAEPADLGSGLLLAEVKGPGDQVRDAQAAWFDALLTAGAPVELWKIRRGEPSTENP